MWNGDIDGFARKTGRARGYHSDSRIQAKGLLTNFRREAYHAWGNNQIAWSEAERFFKRFGRHIVRNTNTEGEIKSPGLANQSIVIRALSSLNELIIERACSPTGSSGSSSHSNSSSPTRIFRVATVDWNGWNSCYEEARSCFWGWK